MSHPKPNEARKKEDLRESEIDEAWGAEEDSRGTSAAKDARTEASESNGAAGAESSGAAGPADADASTSAIGSPAPKVSGFIETPRGAEAHAPVLIRGNRLRIVRGGLIMLAGGFIAFSLMAADAQFRFGVPLGVLAIAVTSFGILDLLGTFDDPDEHVANRVSVRDLARPLAAVGASFLATMLFIGATVAGRLPVGATAVLVPASFLALVASTFRTGFVLGSWRFDENGQERPLLQRHGFWVVTMATLLYLPLQGSYSLSDPWETHYGEVAREMLARNDWISTWWAQDGWFWSKPVLDFWTQAIAMATFGVKYKSGQMLLGAEHGHTPWPEWAVRMPVFVLTVVGLYFLYKGVARIFGRRAGLIGAIVLATMPQWYLLAHQTITDMPLVSTLCASMGLLLLGIHTDPERRAKAYEIGFGRFKLRVSGYHLVLGVILMSALPQILYLASRNLELQWIAEPHGYRPHLDEFWSGSAGNCGLPGNEACTRHTPVYPQFQPVAQALMWLSLLGIVLWLNWGERRLSRLYFLGAWYFAAVSTLGKGPAGFGLPICATFTYIAATRNWKKLTSLEITSGLLIILCVAIPWYLAMYIRHGQPFTDRLIFHDMWKRAFTHVHDTNEGDDVSFRFYIWQLGYALFLWTGLVPAGLVFWARRRDDAAGGKGDVSVFLAMWFVFAFGLFTAMLTKFHHYIFPAVPPAAMLTGILVNRMLGYGPIARPRSLIAYLGTSAAGVVFAVYGLLRLFPGGVLGNRTDQGVSLPAPRYWLGGLCIAAGLALVAFAYRAFGRTAIDHPEEAEKDRRLEHESRYAVEHERLMLGGAAVAGAVVVALVGRDLATRADPEIVGAARLLHLFTYNYRRAWPESLDFSAVMIGFTIMGVGLCLALAVFKWRRHATVLFMITALVWAVWGVDVYWMKCAPHWGQREVIETYYKMRGSPNVPIIAYQMNWKGENFYTGNRIPAFVSSGSPFSNYLKAETAKGVSQMFFITEWGRMGSLKSEIGTVKNFETLTDKRLDNKFGLFRATF